MAGRSFLDRPPREPEAIADRLVSVGLALAVAAVVVQTTSHLTNALLLGNRVRDLNADVERNAFTWASSVATFAAAFVAVVLAGALPERRRSLALLAGILAFLSLDDAVAIHERVGSIVEIDETVGSVWRFVGLGRYNLGGIWPAVYLPLFALACPLLWAVTREAPGRARRAVRLGLGLLVAGVAAEVLQSVLASALGSRFEGWPRALEVAFEEGAELAGWILVASGLGATACLALVQLGRGLELTSRGGEE